MNNEELKQAAALEAIKEIKHNSIIGVGTGSTVHYLIEGLIEQNIKIKGAVSSSVDTTNKLKRANIEVLELNDVEHIGLYIDGADEINNDFEMIKGGGGALTREKIIAAAADTFICIAHQDKLVKTLGKFPVPIEVIPMAESYVCNELKKISCVPKVRENTITDNNNIIIDIYDLNVEKPTNTEKELNKIPGILTCGIFANRTADILYLSTKNGVLKKTNYT